jgi:ABC-type multidrug transport system fused ATPase/permease subunit
MTNSIAQAAVGLEHIRKILDTDVVIPERANAKPLPSSCRGEITFENVAFGYDPEAPVLKDEASRLRRASSWESSARPAAGNRPW